MTTRLNIISRYDLWGKRHGELLSGALNVPASLPAFLDLEKAGHPVLPVSSVLRTEDYRKTWRESLEATLSLVEKSMGGAAVGPNLSVIHAYSLFRLFANVKIIEKFLEFCFSRYEIGEMVVENRADFTDEDRIYFETPELYSPYYQDVAVAWAEARGVKVTVLSPWEEERADGRGPSLIRGGASFLLRHPLLLLEKVLGRALRWIVLGAGLCRNVLAYLCGARRFVFYFPFRSAGLRHWAPSFWINAAPLFWCLQRALRVFPKGAPLRGGEDLHRDFLQCVENGFVGSGGLIRERISRSLEAHHSERMMLFQIFTRVLEWLRQQGIQAALVSVGPFVDWGGVGYVAEAFRKLGFPIGGVQHGGNYFLDKEWSVIQLLPECQSNFFFQWGKLKEDFSKPDFFTCRRIQTGSPRTRELTAMGDRSASRKLPGRIRTLLYAPTLLNLGTTTGQNVPWDRYVKIFLRTCEILNQSDLACTVKTLPTPEYKLFDSRRFPKLHFIRRSGFVDHMGEADTLLVDSLNGSPIYEALATNKPILLYDAAEYRTWESGFLEKLARRVVCFFDDEDYGKGLREFVSDPDGFLARSGVGNGSGLVDEYMPPVSQGDFYARVGESLFPSLPTPRSISKTASL